MAKMLNKVIQNQWWRLYEKKLSSLDYNCYKILSVLLLIFNLPRMNNMKHVEQKEYVGEQKYVDKKKYVEQQKYVGQQKYVEQQ